MFKKEIYTMIAKEFATPIGIAEINLIPVVSPAKTAGIASGSKAEVSINSTLDSPKVSRVMEGINETVSSPEGRKLFRDRYDELRVNNIILNAIRKDKYRVLMRGVWHQRQAQPLWSERRVYSTVWKAIQQRASRGVSKSNVVVQKPAA